jgi:hypothetical protein
MVLAYVDTGHNKLKVSRNDWVSIFEPDIFRGGGGALNPRACWDGGDKNHGGPGCISRVSVVCCHIEVSATGLSLAQRGPTVCDVSEYESETSISRRPWPTGGCCAIKKLETKTCLPVHAVVLSPEFIQNYKTSVLIETVLPQLQSLRQQNLQ